MKKNLITIITYILIFFNSNLLSDEKKSVLKVGLLAPLSGEYKELGESLLYSLQLALNEIDDDDLYIIPRDSGYNDEEKLNSAIEDFRSQEVGVVIGPLDNKDFDKVKKFTDIVFISPSNLSPEFQNNIISIGISFESQMLALKRFIKQQKKNKTVILIPKNHYIDFVEKKLNKLKLEEYKIFKYSPDPKILTGEIEILTNYSQRKKNLDLRKKMFEDKDDEQSKRQLER